MKKLHLCLRGLASIGLGLILSLWGCSQRPVSSGGPTAPGTLKENIQETLVLQKEVVDHFQKFLVTSKESASSNNAQPMKEIFEKTANTYRSWLHKMKEVRDNGRELFEKMEKEAQAQADVKKKSDSYRKMIKGKRQFRLMFLSMQEGRKKSARWLRLALDTLKDKAPTEARWQNLQLELNRLQEQNQLTSLQGKGLINSGPEVSGN